MTWLEVATPQRVTSGNIHKAANAVHTNLL